MGKPEKKLSDMAHFELKDLTIIKILICYLIHQLNRAVEPDQLYEIAVGNNIINYFYYQEAIDDLLKTNTILLTTNFEGKQCYILTEKGSLCARSFHNYVPKTYRDNLVKAGLQYFSRLKLNNEIKIEYIPIETGGYYVHCRCIDIQNDLIDLKLFAPDETQAHLLGEQIMLNPIGFYSRIINFALGNKEEEYDMSNN